MLTLGLLLWMLFIILLGFGMCPVPVAIMMVIGFTCGIGSVLWDRKYKGRRWNRRNRR